MKQSRIILQLYKRNVVEKGHYLKSKHQGKKEAPGSLPHSFQDLALQSSFLRATYITPLPTWLLENLKNSKLVLRLH